MHDELQINTQIRKLGRNVLFSDCEIYLGNNIVCKGSHIKAMLSGNW